VNDLIAATMIVIEQKETDLLKRVALVERLKDELSLFNPFNKDAQQWSNITLARILLNRYLQQQRVVVTDED
jgi:lipopolysaccharide biosynthesis glycosyltransferase